MKQQNYKNHHRFVFLYHFVTAFLIIVLFISSIYYTISAANLHMSLKPGLFLLLVSIILGSIYYYARLFALRAQDRAIRAEENFRYYLLTGKTLDSKLTMRQIIGLRFAPDDEFPELAKKAVDENMSEDDIKKAVKNWKGDYYRA